MSDELQHDFYAAGDEGVEGRTRALLTLGEAAPPFAAHRGAHRTAAGCVTAGGRMRAWASLSTKQQLQEVALHSALHPALHPADLGLPPLPCYRP